MKKLLIAGALAASFAGGAVAKEYTLQSAFPKGLPVVGAAAERFAEGVSTLTGAKVAFKHLGAGELSPPAEILENVGAGAIDAGWSYAGYDAGKAPAAALYGSIPFGPDAIKYVSWVHHGGGLEILREIYAPFNVVPMPCGVIISEAGGWFNKTINTVDDLSGLKIRIGGLGGAIYARLGANATSLPVGEISTALETGRIDATELSFPTVDTLLGFDKVAKFYYFPGWHQPSGFVMFYMNKDAWAALSDEQRRAIETACADVNMWSIGVASAAQKKALDAFTAKGVTIKRFPQPVLDKLRTASDAVLAEMSEKDPLFRKAIESYRAFSVSYDAYQELSTLK